MLFACAPLLHAARYYPFFNANVMLGQHILEGDTSGFGGNFSVLYVPAVKYSDSFGLLPTLRTSYSATRSVVDLAGGGQLFQSSFSNDVLVKGLWSPSPKWRIKPSAGFGMEFLRETKDEKLFDGLFDYRKSSVGLEAELIRSPQEQIAVGVSHYRIQFPNYKSLESSVGSGLGRANQGDRVLDTVNNAFQISYAMPLVSSRTRLTVAYDHRVSAYPDQAVVIEAGDLSSSSRRDTLKTFSGSVSHPLAARPGMAMVARLSVGRSRRSSNQNFYEFGQQPAFTSGYYDYAETTLRPRMDLQVGEAGGSFSAEFLWIRRSYDNRRPQEADGKSRGGTLALSERAVILDVKVPLVPRLALRAKSSFSDSRSNTDYEKVFRTNYQFSNHMLGVEYGF